MKEIIEFAVLVPLFVIFYQFYSYSVSSKGEARSKKCLTCGIAFSTLGITGLAFQSIITVFGGVILIMMGFRLLAYGLDRVDKKVFIDRFDDDNTPADLQGTKDLTDPVLTADDQILPFTLQDAARKQSVIKEDLRNRHQNLPDCGTELPGSLLVGSK
jgi:hypothetical protein